MTSDTYQKELDAALEAVHRASLVTKKIQRQADKGVSDKSDASPVTVADFAAQALIICAIHHKFPEDDFVAEESSEMLRASPALSDRVWDLVTSMKDVGDLPIPSSKDDMMTFIDMGGDHSEETHTSGPLTRRTWILDPIDGTKTFACNQQYAVCLCFLESGQQKVAALGCPNMLFQDQRVEESLTDLEGNGLMLAAVAGRGAFFCPLDEFAQISARRLLKSPRPVSDDFSNLCFLDSKSSSNVSKAHHSALYTKFGHTSNYWPTDIWAMQVKYVALALGAADAIFRVSPNQNFRACVWDHAGGQLLVEEAGGVVTDSYGNKFDFATSGWNKYGRTFKDNRGYIAAVSPEVHDLVLKEVKEVMADSSIASD